MKKLLAFMMTLVMMLGIVGGVVATEAHAAEHSHCICGGKAVGVGDHTACASVTWTELTADVAASALATGNYYLGADLTLTARLQVAQDANVNICLNGYSLKGSDGASIGTLFVQKGNLSVCDCKGTGVVEGNSPKEGSCLYIIGETLTVNLFSGTLKYQGGAIDNNGPAVSINKGVLNIYNAVITGGISNKSGGNLYVKRGTVNMYGGKIINGVAANNGGNVYIKNQSDADTYPSIFNLYNGTISGGTLTNTEDGAKSDIYVQGTLNLKNAAESLYVKFEPTVVDKADFSKMDSSLSGVPTTSEGLQKNFLITKAQASGGTQTGDGTQTGGAPVTGDTANTVIIVLCMVVAAAGMVYFVPKKRRA